MQEYTRIIIQNVGPAANAEFVRSGGPEQVYFNIDNKKYLLCLCIASW